MIVSEDLKHVAIEAAKQCKLPAENVLVFSSKPPWILKAVNGSKVVRKGEEGAVSKAHIVLCKYADIW